MLRSNLLKVSLLVMTLVLGGQAAFACGSSQPTAEKEVPLNTAPQADGQTVNG